MSFAAAHQDTRHILPFFRRDAIGKGATFMLLGTGDSTAGWKMGEFFTGRPLIAAKLHASCYCATAASSENTTISVLEGGPSGTSLLSVALDCSSTGYKSGEDTGSTLLTDGDEIWIKAVTDANVDASDISAVLMLEIYPTGDGSPRRQIFLPISDFLAANAITFMYMGRGDSVNSWIIRQASWLNKSQLLRSFVCFGNCITAGAGQIAAIVQTEDAVAGGTAELAPVLSCASTGWKVASDTGHHLHNSGDAIYIHSTSTGGAVMAPISGILMMEILPA